MKCSWRVATVRGIDIKIHATFALAVAWGALMWGSGTLYGALYGALLTLLLFAVVLLHELGHAVVAQHFGIEVHDIVLLPIGGVARLSRMPEKPEQELWVALAGPAVNLFLGLLIVPLLVGGAAWQVLQGNVPAWPAISSPGVFNLAAFLVIVNASLLLFNMLPAFPMDGGRVLRALLAMRWPHRRATQVAVIGGRAFAVLFGALAIYTANIFLGMVSDLRVRWRGQRGASRVWAGRRRRRGWAPGHYGLLGPATRSRRRPRLSSRAVEPLARRGGPCARASIEYAGVAGFRALTAVAICGAGCRGRSWGHHGIGDAHGDAEPLGGRGAGPGEPLRGTGWARLSQQPSPAYSGQAAARPPARLAISGQAWQPGV